MQINWNAMTAISTVALTLFTLGLMIATIWLAIIALKAKNTWKKELIESKKLESLINFLTKYTDIMLYLDICTRSYAVSEKTSENPPEKIDYKKEQNIIDFEIVNKQKTLIKSFELFLYFYPEYEANKELLLESINTYRNAVFDIVKKRVSLYINEQEWDELNLQKLENEALKRKEIVEEMVHTLKKKIKNK